MVSYWANSNDVLRVLHCDDPNCDGVGENITSPDSVGIVGWHTSLALDGNGHPVVSYYDSSNGDLKLLHCLDVACPNEAPVVEAGGDQAVNEGEVVSFQGSASDENEDVLAVEWQFGDGVTATGTLTPTHTYGDNGVYTVTLTATDEHGLAGSDTLAVTVSNVAPVVEAGQDVTVLEGDPVSFAGAFTDPGVADGYTIAWALGDGATATGTLTPTHAYTAPGVYTVALTVTDDDGGVGTDTLAVTVEAGEFLLYLPVVLNP